MFATLFFWAGDRVVDTVQLLLRAHGLSVQRDGIALTIGDVTPTALGEHIRALVSGAPPDPTHLARSVGNKRSGKYDRYLDEDLLSTDYASRRLDIAGAWRALHDIARVPH